MKTGLDRIILAVLVLIVIVTGMVLLGRERESADSIIPLRSSYGTNPTDCKALYLALQQANVRVERLRTSLETLQTGRAVFILAPAALGESAWTAVGEWVSEGHLGVVAVDQLSEVLSPPGREPVMLPLWQRGIGQGLSGVPAWGEWRMTPHPGDRGGALSQRDPWVASGFPTLLFEGAAPLAADDRGWAVAWIVHGRGAYLLFQSPWALSNAGLGTGDTFGLVRNALQRFPGDGAVYFDEYDHGFRDGGGGLWAATPVDVRWGLFQGVLAFLLFGFYVGVRTRSPVPLPGEGRSRAEYLSSMASLFGRAQVTSVVLREEFSALPEILDSRLLDRVRDIKQEAERPGTRSEGQTLALVRQLRQVEKEARTQL